MPSLDKPRSGNGVAHVVGSVSSVHSVRVVSTGACGGTCNLHAVKDFPSFPVPHLKCQIVYIITRSVSLTVQQNPAPTAKSLLFETTAHFSQNWLDDYSVQMHRVPEPMLDSRGYLARSEYNDNGIWKSIVTGISGAKHEQVWESRRRNVGNMKRMERREQLCITDSIYRVMDSDRVTRDLSCGDELPNFFLPGKRF